MDFGSYPMNMTGTDRDLSKLQHNLVRRGLWFTFGIVFALAGDAGRVMASSMSASELLSQLKVEAEQASSTYDRDLFNHWTDADNDCQDARVEVLTRDSKAPITKSCRVTVGRWLSWYDGEKITQASKIDIDHMVPLKEAWESGAWSWPASQREAYANDLGFVSSLTAVSKSSNQSKQDRDPAGWLPRYEQCRYAQDWVAVKYRWQLTIDRSEQQALQKLLTADCGKKIINVTQVSVLKPGTTPSTTAPSTSGGASSLDPRFSTCRQAKSSGYGPYKRGVDPEYSWYRDADKDGRVCE